MRIAISGPLATENTQLIDKFSTVWTDYKKSEKSDELLKRLETAETNESLLAVLNGCIDEAMKYNKTDNVLFGCSVLDVLAKMFLLKAKDDTKIEDLTIQKAIHLAKQGLHFYEIIFLLPYIEKYSNLFKKVDDIVINPDETTIIETASVVDEAEKRYILELNNFYLEMQETYLNGLTWIFDFKSIDGAPALIEIFGNIDEQVQMLKLYLKTDGTTFNKDESLIQEIINN